jgi:hypothetical protein
MFMVATNNLANAYFRYANFPIIHLKLFSETLIHSMNYAFC